MKITYCYSVVKIACRLMKVGSKQDLTLDGESGTPAQEGHREVRDGRISCWPCMPRI